MILKKVNDIGNISCNKRITCLSKIIQSTVTKLINNKILVKYHKIANSAFNIATSIDP